MFVWLLLAECNVDALAKTALEFGVAVVPSSVFYHDNNTDDYDARSALR
tara:strand:+ start:1067 stop:1213 length:147 start_codon:yes stop_codon:yes gene_type:complete